MIGAIVYLVVIGIVIALAYWVIDMIPIPQPLNRWIKMAIVIIGVICLIMILLQLTGVSLDAPRLK